MGGFNFGTEDKILRWLHRGDTIYDVIVPEDAEVILCDEEKGIYRSNKIIVTNPRPITDDMVMELYKKTTLSDKIIAQCLVTLLWKKRNEISKYIIKDRVNLNNINEILEEFVRYAGEDNLYSESGKEIYEILQEIQKYSGKKKSLYKWYKKLNEFIKRIDEIKICKEYLNLYDKDGNLVNKKGIRGEKTEYLKGIVIIFIENGNGEFLIQKTSNSRNSTFATTGGHVTYGSTFKESIIKEVKEELGIDISNEKIIEVYTYIWGYYLQKVYYLRKDIDINNINIQEDEVDYVKWIDRETINKLIENKEFREGNIEGYQYIINNYK